MDSGRRSNIFYEGDPVSFRLSTPGALSYTVRDYYGQVVDSGPVSGDTLSLGVGQLGWYKVYLQGNVMQTDWGNSVGGTTFCIFRRDARFPTFPDSGFQKLLKTEVGVMPALHTSAAPTEGVPARFYATRYTGQILPQYSETYTFTTTADDGIRLWVNDRLIIDDWNRGGRNQNSATITLQANVRANIRIDYRCSGFESYLSVDWSSPSRSQETVPVSRLYSSSSASTANGLTAAWYSSDAYISRDGAQDSALEGVLASGVQRLDAFLPYSSETTQQVIDRLRHDIAISKDFYVGRDSARPRPLLVVFRDGVTGREAAATQIGSALQNDVQYWESVNEPNFRYDATRYAQGEMKTFYNLVKGVNQNLKVIGPSCVSIGTGGDSGLYWAQNFLKEGGGQYIDVFGFHAYNNVNGDAELARWSLNGLNSMLATYGLQNIEKWQTEQAYPAAYYGLYAPRHQGRWTMLQKVIFEQYGIPKEHDHLWYDKSHGFWQEPTWMENDDSSLNPAAPLMRVWSEEVFGTTFSKALDFGNPGNKLMVGNLFVGANRQVAALMSTGATDLSVQMQTSSNAPVKVVSAFGVSSVVTPANNRVTVAVDELPVYVESAAGQTLDVVPLNWGSNLALASGTTAVASGRSWSPMDPVFEKAFDGNTATSFRAPTSSGSFVELDTGNSVVRALKARYFVPADEANSMTGGLFQGSNDRGNWTTLGTIPAPPPLQPDEVRKDRWSVLDLGSTAYRYLRYLSPSGSNFIMSELEFYDSATKLAGTASGTPGSASVTPNGTGKLINGKLENWRMTQQGVDEPWASNQPTTTLDSGVWTSPVSVEVRLPAVQSVNRVVIYACVPFSTVGSLLDYELQYDDGGNWVSLGRVSEAPRTVSIATPVTRTTVDSFYSDRSVFSHAFQAVQTSKIRLLINEATWGGGVNLEAVNAGGQNGPHQATLREIEIYNSGGTTTTPAPTNVYEAEQAALSGGAGVSTSHPGYSGTGYVEGYWNQGAKTTFTVSVPAYGSYPVSLRYARPLPSDATLSLYVNGSKVKQTLLPAQGDWDTWSEKSEALTLNAGSNTIAYSYDSGDMGVSNLDRISIGAGTPMPTPTPTTKYEAEKATLSGGAGVSPDHTGYSGTGYVDGYWNQGAVTIFTVNTQTAGSYPVTLRYAKAAPTDSTLSIYVNGIKIKQTLLPARGDWDTWSDKTETLNLNAGSNTIAYSYDSSDTGVVNLDCITLPAPPPPTRVNTKHEAEQATLSGGAHVEVDHHGYSGTAYVDGYWNQGAKTTFTVQAQTSGSYPVILRYAKSLPNDSTLSIYVNGVKVKQTLLPARGDWDTWSDKIEILNLNAGSNTIAYSYDSSDAGSVNLDCITLPQ